MVSVRAKARIVTRVCSLGNGSTVRDSRAKEPARSGLRGQPVLVDKPAK